MRYPKSISLRFPFFLFIILFLLVFTDIFYFEESTPFTAIDRVFYLIIHISFWLSTAYLFNSIVNKFYWGSFLKVPVGNTFLQKVKNFISTSVYIIVLVVVLVGYFGVEFNFELAAVGLLAAVIGSIIRPHLVCSVRSVFLSNSVAFNIGDWIKLEAINSSTKIIGEVDYIDRKNLKIKTEDNNIVTIAQSSLDEFLIENFSGSGREARFEVTVNIDFAVSPRRVKRVLQAAAKQAIEEYDFLDNPPTHVRIKGISESGIEYGVYFWIIPWEKISPADAKDKIIEKVVEHLNLSGLSLSYPKEDIFISKMPERQTQLSSKQDVKKILSSIELFQTLNEKELSELSQDLVKLEFSTGEMIIKEGEEGDSMFVVIEGLLDVLINSEDGHQIKVGRLAPGEFFGEMSLMTGEKRSATVIAATDVLLFEITKESISKIINQRDIVINDFGEIITRRNQVNVQFREEYERNKHTFIADMIKKIKTFFNRK